MSVKKSYLLLVLVIGILATSNISATTMNFKQDLAEKSSNGNINKIGSSISKGHDYGIIAKMTIDPTQEDDNERATVELFDSSFTINKYKANDPIRFSAEYEIVKDIIGEWDEAPFPVPPVHHETTIEKWEFGMRAELERNNGDIIRIGKEKIILNDGPWDKPPEILLAQAPSSVIEGGEFSVLVTFQGYPTYEFNACQNEEVTFNGETKVTNSTTGIVNFTAPEVDSDQMFTIDAFKDWNAVDDHNFEEIITNGSTKIKVLDDPAPKDLVVTTDSSIMERENFDVFVTKDGSPVTGAIVFFNDDFLPSGITIGGKATFDAPSVETDQEVLIRAYHPDFVDINNGSTKMMVHANYDDEADQTDESGLLGNFTLELNLDRSAFYKPLITEGYQTYTKVNIILDCTRYLWCWKPPKFERKDTSWGSTATLDIKIENNPVALELSGPEKGKVGESYDFNAHAVDPDGDPIHFFCFFWGDGNYNFDNNDFTGFPYDTELTKSHSYEEKETYIVTVEVQDAIGDSRWDTFETTMPKLKSVMHPTIKGLFLKLIEVLNLPLLKKILI